MLLAPEHDAAVLVDLCQTVGRAVARRLSEAEHFVRVGGDVPVQVPGEVAFPDRLGADVQLDTPVPDGAGVDELEVREAAGRRHVARQDRVVRRLVVEGEVDADAIVQGARLEAELGAAAHLGAEVGVADELRRQDPEVVGAGRRPVGLQRGKVVGLLPRFAERPADPHLVEPADVPPRLLADHPAAADLGIDLVAHVRAESAVAIDAHRPGDEQAVLPRELLLHVTAERVVLGEVLGGHDSSRGRHGGEAGCREALTVQVRGVSQPVVVLTARRGDRTQSFRDREVDSGVVVDGARRGIASTLVLVARRGGRIEVLREAVGQVRYELHVHLVGHVRAHHEPLREPARRPVLDLEAPGEAIHVLPIGDGDVVDAGRVVAEALRGRPEVLRGREERLPHRAAAARLEAQVGTRLVVAHVQRELELVVRHHAHVGPAAVAPEDIVRLHTVVMIEVRRHEVANHRCATAHVERVALRVPVAEDRAAVLSYQRVVIDRLDRARARVQPVVHREPTFRVHEPLRALFGGQLPGRRAHGALLRDDGDDATRGFRAVQRGRGGALDDLDALNVRRIVVVETRDHAGAERLHIRAGALVVVDANAVHVEQRVVQEREARDPSDPDLRSRARLTGAGQDLDPRCAAVDERLHVRDRRTKRGHVGRVDRGHHIPDGSLLLAAGRTRYDHRVQLDRRLDQGEEDARVAHADAARQWQVTDNPRRERHLPLPEPRDPEPAGGVGDRRATLARAHLHRRERAQRAFGDDRTRHESLLSRLLLETVGEGGCGGEKQNLEERARQGSHGLSPQRTGCARHWITTLPHGTASYAAAAISPTACAIVRSMAPCSADTGTLFAYTANARRRPAAVVT